MENTNPIEVKSGASTSEAMGKVIATIITAISIPAVTWINSKIGVDLDPTLFATLVVAVIAAVTGMSISYTGSRTKVKTAAANAAADVEVARLQKDVAALELSAAELMAKPTSRKRAA